ncbi:caspase-1-like [Achroia grisella]|uniref:caspase-1-like n=1 Tax=Achroia grisella TaxID=688607 RepID=UPI0027D2BB62|nr:caspase-1-like [Achroia grisella]
MDEADALPFRLPTMKSKPTDEKEAEEKCNRRRFDPNALYYDMSGDKHLLIFNHYAYQSTVYFRNKKPSTRKGTFGDVERLNNVFKSLNFKVASYTDLYYSNIKENINAFIANDHSNTSCICVVFLTHGNCNGELYAADRPFSPKIVMSLFENVKLATIPKLFIIQACRGEDVDAGTYVSTDTTVFTDLHIPTHIDFLTLYASVEGIVAFRDKEGSWMIQELCNVIEKYYKEYDILHLITLANKAVAFERTAVNKLNLNIDQKKQTLETKFTLTKILKLA